ncbi:hypothetical protein EBQ74_06800 [bacterium]|nr:hypothetical protein [bacterium]
MVTGLTTFGTSIGLSKVVFWTLFISLSFSRLCLSENEKFDRHPIVEIFCTAVLENADQEKRAQSLDQIWLVLEQHFESGKLFSALLNTTQIEQQLEKTKNTPIFKKCVDENRHDFEYGEFLISGKKIVRMSLELLQKSGTAHLSEASFNFADSSILPPDMALNLSDPSIDVERSKTIETISKREKRYNALWQDFLAHLKDRSKRLQF